MFLRENVLLCWSYSKKPRHCFFIPDDYKVYFDIFLESKRLLDQSTNKKVCVSVTNWNTENKNPQEK